MTAVDQGMRVLVVDDEPMVREVLERYLTRGEFVAETAGDLGLWPCVPGPSG